MKSHGLDISFSGITEEQFLSGDGRRVSVLSGTNNCGKSLILKELFLQFGEEAFLCGTDRHYVMNQFPGFDGSPAFAENTLVGIRRTLRDEDLNQDPPLMPFQSVFNRMKDDERESFYEICSECLQERVALHYIDPGNRLSPAYLRIGPTSVAHVSSGARMLFQVVAVLLSKRFNVALIDEPELGLTPRIQDKLAQFIFDSRFEAFAHLRHIYIATHSHVFLNRRCVSDNFLVERDGGSLRVKQLTTFGEFRALQFTQLGNSFEHLQLPSGFLIVEGKTDYQYLHGLLLKKFPRHRVTVIPAHGNGKVKGRLHDLLEIIGDLEKSPYNSRVVVVLDKTHEATLPAYLQRKGLGEGDVIVWKKNGIEYYYPEAILRSVFEDDSLSIDDLIIDDNDVSHGSSSMTKAELSKEVLDRLTGSEELDPELHGLLERVESFC